MYVQFTADVKNAVNTCWTSVQDIMKQQEQNAARYQEPYLSEENKKLDASKAAAADAARERVREICDKAAQDAATLDTLNPFDVDNTAMKMLSGAFTLSVPQVQHIVDEYGKNPTMQNAISTYCENHNMRLHRATTESRRAGIEEIRQSALSLIGQIGAARFENARATLNLPLLISSFLDGRFAGELEAKLGQTFNGNILSPTVTAAEQFDFHFQPAGSAWTPGVNAE